MDVIVVVVQLSVIGVAYLAAGSAIVHAVDRGSVTVRQAAWLRALRLAAASVTPVAIVYPRPSLAYLFIFAAVLLLSGAIQSIVLPIAVRRRGEHRREEDDGRQ